jgi:acetyl-CoA acetyltransferase
LEARGSSLPSGQTTWQPLRYEAQYALATQCIGGGQGIATILEAA